MQWIIIYIWNSTIVISSLLDQLIWTQYQQYTRSSLHRLICAMPTSNGGPMLGGRDHAPFTTSNLWKWKLPFETTALSPIARQVN
uniref:Putative secreted protein n=1 Tax=Anopheles marajoara TaxID=58244 RepID=A0A2M4CAQ0_9DIPT